MKPLYGPDMPEKLTSYPAPSIVTPEPPIIKYWLTSVKVKFEPKVTVTPALIVTGQAIDVAEPPFGV